MVFNQFHGAIPKGKACHQLPRGLVKSFGKQSQFIIVIFIVRSHHPLAEPIGWLEAHRHGSNFFCMAKFFRLRINLQSGLRSLSVSSDFLEPPDYESLTEIAAKAPANASHWNLVRPSPLCLWMRWKTYFLDARFQLNLLQLTISQPVPFIHSSRTSSTGTLLRSLYWRLYQLCPWH